jgi:acyl-CoA reductase-like NAD-dependent aldehyde dehydrogenase
MAIEPLSASFDLTYLERYSLNLSLPQGQSLPRNYSFDGSSLPDLTATSEEGAEVAIEKAYSSFRCGKWKNCSIQQRVKIISRAVKSLQERSAEAAYLDALETGRSFFSLVNHSLPKAVQTALWFCNTATNTNGNFYQSQSSQNIAFDSSTAYGVVLCILPWNDPLVLFCWKVIPALLLGNSVIVKPSEYSTGSALLFAELLHNAGVPREVLQVVVGRDTKAFNLLIDDSRVRSIAMTGSSETAKYIQKHSSSFLKKLNFECGGKSAFIIPDKLDESELNRCAEVLVRNMFYNQGQICSAPSLLVVNSSVFSQLSPIIKRLAASYLPGNPFSSGQMVGQICTDAVLLRTKTTLLTARDRGLEVWSHPGLSNSDIQYGEKSHPPSFITCQNLSEYLGHTFLHQEVFGPVLTVVISNSYDEMIDIANHSPFGLASAVWSSNINTLSYFTSRIDSGIVHLNTWGDDDIGIPFGGTKDSGEAREKCLETFNQFSYKKTIHISLDRVRS